MRISDWSSDVCSSDLPDRRGHRVDLIEKARQHEGWQKTGEQGDLRGQELVAGDRRNQQPLPQRRHHERGRKQYESLQRSAQRHAEHEENRKSTRLNSTHTCATRMPTTTRTKQTSTTTYVLTQQH